MKENKENKENKFITTIKKKWLIKGTTTFLLVLIILAIFIGINIFMQNLELTPLDFSKDKLYTLTEESKEKVKNIDKDINMYFIGYSQEDTTVDLAKQYNKANEKISVEVVDIAERPDIAEKYGIESGTNAIVIECGEKSKILTENDLYTYDMTTYETIDIAEEKLTSSLISINSEKIPKVYFLEGYSEFSLNTNLYGLGVFLQNEVNEVSQLNVLSTGKIPDDCDTLVIMTPNKDFDDVALNAITNYIQSGRNILWMNAVQTQNKNLPNVNKILEMYGVKPFEVGYIRETDNSKMVMNVNDIIIPEIQYSTITEDIYNTSGVLFLDATKINIDEEKLEELKVNKTDLLLASENSYFRTDFNNQSNAPEANEQKGTFIVGAELEKTIKDANEETGEKAITSKLVIYGENYFATDYPIDNQSNYSAVQLGYNKDLALNSIAYLVDRQEDITARKDTGTVSYTATETQSIIIQIIIFAVPILIIIAGIIIWQVRRRKK